MNWSAVTRLFLISATWAFADSATERRPQEQPPSYVNQSQRADRDAFLSHVDNHVGVNQQIPSVTDNELRVITYNVHFHQDIFGKKVNNEYVKNDLERMQASVVIFQEVITDDTKERQGFNSMLRDLGYKYQEFSAANGAFLGNMIASKVPLKRLLNTDLGHVRVLLSVEADFNGQKVAILGTHLEVGSHKQRGESEKIRTQQANMIVDVIKNQIAPNYSHYLLAGDMNAWWNSPAVKVFRQSGLLYETFETLKAPPPNYTCWAGTTIDFIFVSKGLAADTLGSYVYQTSGSDHLPVLVDFSRSLKQLSFKVSAMNNSTPSVESNGVNWSKWGIIGLCSLAVLGVASGLILYFVKRPSTLAKPDSEAF